MSKLRSWLSNFPRQYRTHQNADLPLDEYIQYYSEKLKLVTIGCSFAPDLVEQMYRLENGIHDVSVEKKLENLKVLIHDFGIKNIRLGIKWNKVVNSKGAFDFSYYHPYLDYCLSHGVQVCLNVGPIKSFGWPEEHIPDQFIESRSSMVDTSVGSNSEMAKFALEYLDTLLQHIRSAYSKKQLQNLVVIQPENEPFNQFGKYKLKITYSYLCDVIKHIVDVFPDMKVLLSSSETKDLPQIERVINRLEKHYQIPATQCIVGINYYYNLPGYLKVPKLGPVDAITVSNLLQKNTHHANILKSRKRGYDIEVTEAQFEQWGRVYLSPGNSHHEAKYLFARIVENILDPERGGLIRLWGFERYAKKKIEKTLTQDHKNNLELISKINNI